MKVEKEIIGNIDIGIHLDDSEYEYAKLKDLVYDAGDHEIGFLKINPDRVCTVYGLERTKRELDRINRDINVITLSDLGFALVTDDRSTQYEDGIIKVYGNAYIARKQGDTITGLSAGELLLWISSLWECMEKAKKKDAKDDNNYYYGFRI